MKERFFSGKLKNEYRLRSWQFLGKINRNKGAWNRKAGKVRFKQSRAELSLTTTLNVAYVNNISFALYGLNSLWFWGVRRMLSMVESLTKALLLTGEELYFANNAIDNSLANWVKGFTRRNTLVKKKYSEKLQKRWQQRYNSTAPRIRLLGHYLLGISIIQVRTIRTLTGNYSTIQPVTPEGVVAILDDKIISGLVKLHAVLHTQNTPWIDPDCYS